MLGGPARFYYTARSGAGRNGHPTVKPLDLVTWLCKITRPPTGGTVLDPFMGSGTTILAALAAGRRVVGIELEPKYIEIAENRIGDELAVSSTAGR